MNIYIGRQPIFDRAGNIYSYELLYRNSNNNSFPNVDPAKATISLLINAFITIGFEQISGGRYSFINFTGDLLLEDSLDINPEQVVIELLEDVVITPEIIERLRQFKNDGFKIALDDFVLTQQYEQYPELFELIKYIKVDFLNTTVEDRSKIENLAKSYPNIVLIAEKIETEHDYTIAKELGYNLFQGYFFARPEIIQSMDVPSNYVIHVQVLNLLNKDEPNMDEIAELISRDVSLSYKMLRYINSPTFHISVKVTSIKQALVLIGIEESRKWIQTLLVHDMGDKEGSGRVQAVVELALIRAKLCELIAQSMGIPDSNKYFLMALFSLIDIIMKREKEEILPLLPLSEEIKATILGESTSMQPYLKLVEAVENLDLDKIKHYSMEIGIENNQLAKFTHESIAWINQFNEKA